MEGTGDWVARLGTWVAGNADVIMKSQLDLLSPIEKLKIDFLRR